MTAISICRGEAMKRRVAILISGRGSNMAALIKAAAAADYPAEIAVVISNRADALGLERAKASGIPTVVIESKAFDHDGWNAARLRPLQPQRIGAIGNHHRDLGRIVRRRRS